MRSYVILIFWSDEDRAHIAEIPELPGCLAHGVTSEIALVNAQGAKELWIATAKEFGDVIPEPKER